MNKSEQLNLIKGIFSDEDAKEILMNIIATKIHFHEVKNFSSIERYGKKDENGLKRILELKESAEQLTLIISEAKKQNKKLKIFSVINIELEQ